MIEFLLGLLNPARLKLLLAGGGVLLVVTAALFIGVIYLNGALDTERADHAVTQVRLEVAVREGLRWKAAVEETEPKIVALQTALSECQRRESREISDAAEREAIIQGMIPIKRPLERGLPKASPIVTKENEHEVTIVDEATRRAAVARLNRGL